MDGGGESLTPTLNPSLTHTLTFDQSDGRYFSFFSVTTFFIPSSVYVLASCWSPFLWALGSAFGRVDGTRCSFLCLPFFFPCDARISRCHVISIGVPFSLTPYTPRTHTYPQPAYSGKPDPTPTPIPSSHYFKCPQSFPPTIAIFS